MRNRFLILFLVVATLVACNSDSMISDDFSETAEKRNAVPFKVKKAEGTYSFGYNLDQGCVVLNANGTANASHLGKSTVVEEWCWNGQPTDVGERSITFTAANGDELRGKIISIVYPDFPVNFDTFIEVVDIDVDNEFGSGTGRFANAKGTITQTVVTTPDASQTPIQGSGTFTYSAEGTLKY